MSKAAKKPTYNFLLQKNGEKVNLKDLPKEDQEKVGVWAYQTLIKGLGYMPVKSNT